jgi:hypothetical protein
VIFLTEGNIYPCDEEARLTCSRRDSEEKAMSTLMKCKRAVRPVVLAALSVATIAMLSGNAQAAPRGMSQMLGAFAQDEEFQEMVGDFADEHGLGAMKGMMAKQALGMQQRGLRGRKGQAQGGMPNIQELGSGLGMD